MRDEAGSEITSGLTGRQARFLRGLGHHLVAKITVGREGLSATLVAATDAQLAHDELVKVRVGNGCEMDRRDAAQELAARTGAEVAQILGKTFLLFRENPDKKQGERIILP